MLLHIDKKLLSFRFPQGTSNTAGNETSRRDFDYINSLQIMHRIKILSGSMLFFSIALAAYDFFVWKDVRDIVFKASLISIHLISILASGLYVLFYRRLMCGLRRNSKLLLVFPVVYVFLFVLVGTVTGINSQRLSGNIDAYTVIIMTAAAAFPLKPMYMLSILVLNHILFIAGIHGYHWSYFDLPSKYINSSALVIVSIILSFLFYKFRYDEFLNERKLEESRKNLNKLFDITPHPLFLTNFEGGRIIRASKYAYEFLGLPGGSMEASILDVYTDPGDRDTVLKQLSLKGSLHNHIVELKVHGKNIWVMANFELLDYEGQDCILCSIMDITELKLMEEKLSNYASTDTLTGVLNRRKGMQILEKLVEDSKTDYTELTICFIDLNGLKHVNDVFGHSEGDTYINTVCKTIKEFMAPDDTLFRMGGDEFIIIFYRKTSEYVKEIWSRITSEFEAINVSRSRPYKIAVSHGLFRYCSGMDTDIEKMIQTADYEMYREKFMMKGQVG